MRLFIKKKLLEIILTMHEANNVLICNIQTDKNQFYILLSQMLENAAYFEETMKSFEECQGDCIHILNEYRLLLEQCKNQAKDQVKIKICRSIRKKIYQLGSYIRYTIPNAPLKIVFMPYKADMWSSMNSIWKAAKADGNADVKVVPLPYFNISDINNIKSMYEADRFPKELQYVNYEGYSIADEHPDIIVLHNPFDDTNNLTRISERYYSSNLKKFTELLVYSPYFTISAYKKGHHDHLFGTPLNHNADYIVVQSQKVKKIYESYGYDGNKILDYGSPKIDMVMSDCSEQKTIPEAWKHKLADKKIFLLNTHLSYFPGSAVNTAASGDYAVRYHNEILEAFVNREDCALIWRPHPLLKNMDRGKSSKWLAYVNHFEEQIWMSDNCVVDDTSDYMTSFHCSDALITTWSSLLNEYMATGKPALIFQTRITEELFDSIPLNVNLNYFRFGENFVTFKQFRENIIKGCDHLYEKRMAEVVSAFPNLDGMAGENIYCHLKKVFVGV